MTFFKSIIRLCDICFEKCKKFKWFILRAYQTFSIEGVLGVSNSLQRIKLIKIYFNLKFF